MGDVLHALPAVTALRKAHPHWHIGWAIEPRWQSLLTSQPFIRRSTDPNPARTSAQPVVDRIHLTPTKAWGRKPLSRVTRDGVIALRAELKAAQYDAVLDLQGAIRSGVIARLTGCHRIIGNNSPWEKPAQWFYTERVETLSPHVIEQNVELACAIAGDLLTPITPWLPEDAEAEQWCDTVPEIDAAFVSGRPLILVHPGGGWGAKRWPPERYGAVVEELAGRGAFVLVNTAPGEEALSKAVIAAANGEGREVFCTIPQLTAMTRRVSLVIGGDTGPLHLACALGKPVVGIYGPTDPSRNGPFGSLNRVLRNPESRNDHSRLEQPEAGLLTILPRDVTQAAMELLLESLPSRRQIGENRLFLEGEEI